MDNYSISYKRQVDNSYLSSCEAYDLFISAYTQSDRAREVYDAVNATHKIWIVFPHFDFSENEIPKGTCCVPKSTDETDFIDDLAQVLPDDFTRLRLCIDITGFIRPHLMFFIKWLSESGGGSFDALYAEPRQYRKREQTEFSPEIVDEVRQVAGFEGNHTHDISNDILIIGVGYQDHLISQVAQSKAKARKIQMFGYPPLRADMYQENVLKVHLASESLSGGRVNDVECSLFAPAADPFITASSLSAYVRDLEERRKITNLYLCPLATKAQVLGFVLYYLTECTNRSASIIFPFESQYNKSTSRHIERIWLYSVDIRK